MAPSVNQVSMDLAEYNNRPLIKDEKKGLQFQAFKIVNYKKVKLIVTTRHPTINLAVCIYSLLIIQRLANYLVQDSGIKKNANTANLEGEYKEVVYILYIISLSKMSLNKEANKEKKWGPLTSTYLITLS